MFKNYLKIAFRNLFKRKGHSFLNIGGLSIGMATTILIGMWVYDELSYNKDFENYNEIAQVMQTQTFNGEIKTESNQPMQLAPVLRNDYGDYFKHVVTSTFTFDMLLTAVENKISYSGFFSEPGVTEMLSLKMLQGTRDGLQDPSSILLSKTAALSLFGTVDAVGETIKVGSASNLLVSGVYEDLPENNSFSNLKFIAPWEFLKKNQDYENRVGWGNNWFQTFVQIQDGVNMSVASAAIKNSKLENLDAESGMAKQKPVIQLHPMAKWHLYSRFENGINTGGTIDRVWLLGIIGVIILLLACINFMNLNTAQSVKRAKEVGIRKTIGSVKYQLIFQFMIESFVVVCIAFTVSLVLVILAQSTFNEVTNKSLSIPWSSYNFWIVSVLFIAITSLISGSYPSFYLSSFKPIKVLKGTFNRKEGVVPLRKVLVVFQFAISTTLIIGTITIYRQMNYVQNRPLGYNKEGMLYVPITTKDILERFETVREEILRSQDIANVAASDVLVTGTFTTNSGFDWKGKDPDFAEEFNTLRATHDFGEMINWEIKEGRGFSREYKSDSLAFVLNETAVAYMGLKNPIGEYVQWGDSGKFKVIGVVKDMVTRSPYSAVKPTIFTLHYGRFLNFINIKVKPNRSPKEALSHIEGIFKKYNPERTFSYTFLDEEYQQYFTGEARMGKLISFFAILAILISCLGIFGLSAFIAEQRFKEIGIRKVLGASVYSIWKLLSKDFLLLVMISCIIAIPVGYYYMNEWIQDFNYRATLSWWIFAAAVFGSLLTTFLTISVQSIKAAIAKPVKSLRTE
ncbi:ABC transporter permease [uncultured Croceitalea sp.]|uniref:ABC transporter permease n=1 Tax=uncultured Croceitalea sp. TaxID=1798908 RepID=UPI00374FBE76